MKQQFGMRPDSTQRYIFLDRDGTVIVERHYLSDPDQVLLENGVGTALRKLADAGFRLVIVSNQSGIGRGYFDALALEAVNARVAELLGVQGVKIDAWYHCPHTADAGCTCRKPAPGLLDQADADLPVCWHRSFIVGDKRTDIEAGAARGVAGILLKTGHGKIDSTWARRFNIPVVDGFSSIVDIVLGRSGLGISG